MPAVCTPGKDQKTLPSADGRPSCTQGPAVAAPYADGSRGSSRQLVAVKTRDPLARRSGSVVSARRSKQRLDV